MSPALLCMYALARRPEAALPDFVVIERQVATCALYQGFTQVCKLSSDTSFRQSASVRLGENQNPWQGVVVIDDEAEVHGDLVPVVRHKQRAVWVQSLVYGRDGVSRSAAQMDRRAICPIWHAIIMSQPFLVVRYHHGHARRPLWMLHPKSCWAGATTPSICQLQAMHACSMQTLAVPNCRAERTTQRRLSVDRVNDSPVEL